jgi:hypothetical protein
MVDIPDFMKLMECECGWTLYSMDAQPVECPKCYTVVVKRKTDVVADTVITLHECDGMTAEFLFHQPSHGQYLEELSEELSEEVSMYDNCIECHLLEYCNGKEIVVPEWGIGCDVMASLEENNKLKEV